MDQGSIMESSVRSVVHMHKTLPHTVTGVSGGSDVEGKGREGSER